jgi:hypothetical protein
MKKILILLSIVAMAIPVTAQFSIRPQVGYNTSTLTKDFNNLTFTSNDGFQFGLDLQIGERFYIQPGIFWESAKNELKEEVNGNNSSFRINRLRLPFLVGYKLLGPDTDGIIDFRVFTGPNASFAVSKDIKQSALISKGDFRDAVYGWNFGAGLDIAIVFVDAGYSFGLSEVFDAAASRTRNNLFYVNAGLRIGF